MDGDQAASTSYGDEFDSKDTKPLVVRDRGPLFRQAPIEVEPRGASPISPGSVDGRAGEVGGDGDNPNAFQGSTEPAKPRHRRLGPDIISVSEQYYGASVDVTGLPIDFTSSEGGMCKEKRTNRQSRRLPYWIWFMLAKSLGIKMQPSDRPWFGTVMYALTMTFAAGFAITHTWYKVYDIVSHETKETILTGGVSIVMVIYWCSLGIYANKLAGRLFMTPKFLESVRLHSKTVFKISAAGMMVLLGVTEVIINALANRDIFEDQYCERVALSVEVCKVLYVMRIACSVLTVVWNLLVGIILLSVCRTHTIGLRRFIRELEEDGRMYELCRRNMTLQGPLSGPPKDDDYDSTDDGFSGIPLKVSNGTETNNPSCEDVENNIAASGAARTLRQRRFTESDQEAAKSNTSAVVPDTDLTSEAGGGGGAGAHHSGKSPLTMQHSRPIIIIREGSVATADDSVEPITAEQQANNQSLIAADPPSFASRSTRSGCESPLQSTRVELGSPRRAPSTITAVTDGSASDDNISLGLHMLTTDEILLSFWKIGCRLRSTSLAMQRWLCALMIYIILWSLTFIIWWVNHPAELIGIIEFIIPILILPIICSAYGEVNFEGLRMLKCICPTQERMSMLFFLTQNPLQLTAFNFAINYGLIVGALGALGVAFATRLILDEVNM